VKKPPSLFVPLDMNYMRDPAIRRAGPEAELLYVRALAFSKSGDTEGMIYDYDLPIVAVGLKNIAARVASLVRERLWVAVEGGWYIRSWDRWNPSRAEREEERQKRVEGAIKTNHNRYHKGEFNDDCPLCVASLERSLP
jgi:hypothetical protein